jgi:predicted O-linked N-acetylglucosamine transferase (SPINDLY family)
MFSISNTRKPIIFNDISSNLTSQQNPNSLDNRKPRNNYINNNSQINKNYKKINNNNTNTNHSNSIDLKVKINDKYNEKEDNNKIPINSKNQNYSHSNYNHTFNNNNSNNKEKELNLSKSNISESKANKGPVKIKLNPIEKPVLLMNFNESMDHSKTSKNSNNFINVNNSNIIKNERKEIRYNLISDNKRLSLNIDNIKNDLNFSNENGDVYKDNIRGKRKFSEAKSEAESNYSNLSDAKPAQGYSRKIRGFNFRNNIKYNKNPNSNNTSEEDFNKVKGGVWRYNNNDSLFSQINSIENENKQ